MRYIYLLLWYKLITKVLLKDMYASEKIQVYQNDNATSKNISIKWRRDWSNRIKMRHAPICLCRSRFKDKKARESKTLAQWDQKF